MNKEKIGYYLCIAYLMITYSQFHTIIPGLDKVNPGLVSSIILLILSIPYILKMEWYRPLGKYRLLFIISIIPGIFFGFGTGRVKNIFIHSIQELIASFICVCAFINTTKKLQLINRIMLISVFTISVYVLSHGGHGPGIISDENDVALILIMLFPFIYFAAVNNTNKTKKVILTVIIIITIIAVTRTMSRGGMVGILPTLGIIWYKSKHKIQTSSFLILIIAIALMFGPDQVIDEFKSIRNTSSGTAAQRRYYWTLSMEMFMKRPLFGVGASAWGNAVWSGLVYLPMHVRNSTPHSIYYQLISELGTFGTIMWVLLIYTTFKTGIQIKRMVYELKKNIKLDNKILQQLNIIEMLTNSISTGLAGGLICGLFLSFLFYSHLYIFTSLMQTILLITRKLQNEQEKEIDQNIKRKT